MTAQSIKAPRKKPIKKKPLKTRPLTENDIDIAIRASLGKNGAQISKETGISHPTVCRRLKQENIDALVKDIQSRIISDAANDCASNQIRKVQLSKAILNNDPSITLPNIDHDKLLDLGDKVETRILQSIGIYQSHTQSYVFNALINQSNTLIGADILGILQSMNIKRIGHDPEVVDAQVLDDLDAIIGKQQT